MRFTPQQQQLLARYARDVAGCLEDVPARTREQALKDLDQRIRERLHERTNGAAPTDADVDAVLDGLGSPAVQAALAVPAGNAGGRCAGPLASADRVWLGVCLGLADRLETDTRSVRIGMTILGCFTGPLAVLVYLGLFAEMYWSAPRETRPRIVWSTLAGRAGGVLLVAVVLHLTGQYTLNFIHFVHNEWLNRPVPPLGDWAWIQVHAHGLAFWTFVSAVPLAALSGLPMANGWDYTLKRVSQAIVALYAVGLAFGVAAYLVGILLDYAQQFAS